MLSSGWQIWHSGYQSNLLLPITLGCVLNELAPGRTGRVNSGFLGALRQRTPFGDQLIGVILDGGGHPLAAGLKSLTSVGKHSVAALQPKKDAPITLILKFI